MAGLIGRVLRERPTARALLLCPAALRAQWLEVLREDGVPTMLIDRYKFREMLQTTGGGKIWQRGIVAILSDDFAKQADIRDSLSSTQWDLVIADEAHRFVKARAELLQQVSAVAERVVLATLPSMVFPGVFPIEDATVVDWRLDELVDHDGKPFDAVQRPDLHEVSFNLSRAERDLAENIRALCQVLEAGTPRQKVVAKILLRAHYSSPTALESALLRLVEAPEESEEINERPEVVGEVGERGPHSVDPIVAEKTREMAVGALDRLEAIQVDSKLTAFGGLLGDLTRTGTPPARRICVLTDYLSTLYYLAAEIEGRELASPMLHGTMPHEDRQESLRVFRNEGGILVATRAAMSEGLSLSDVTDLVLYDLPADRLALQEILGRFNRYGRTSQLKVYAIFQADDEDSTLLELIGILREINSGIK
jgi:hypothetical protein